MGTPRPPETAVLPLDFLTTFDQSEDFPITLETVHGIHTLVWWIPWFSPTQKARFKVPLLRDLPLFPPTPKQMYEAPGELLKTITQASYLSPRYRIEASAARLIDCYDLDYPLPEGFRFPWTDDVILCGTSVTKHRELRRKPLWVGRVEGYVVLKTGAWTIWLAEQDSLEPPDEE